MPDNQMMQVQRELGSISEALKNAEEYRVEVIRRLDQHNTKTDEQNEKIDAMRGALTNVEQTLKSQSRIVEGIAQKNYDERITKIEERLGKLEDVIKNWPAVESEVMFWRRLLGGTFRTFWKLIALLIGSGGVGALVVKFWPFH